MNLMVLPQPFLIVIAFLISALAGVLFGALPLRQVFKTDPNEAMKSGGGKSVGGRRWALRDLLLAVQIALCSVTVTAAFVSLRGLNKSLTMDLGFQPRSAVLTKFELSQAGYSGEAADHFQRQLLERVSQLPGVQAAAYANTTPLKGDMSSNEIYSLETTDFRPSQHGVARVRVRRLAGYFAAAGTDLDRGRDVSFADTRIPRQWQL